jgi:hypothetical protein
MSRFVYVLNGPALKLPGRRESHQAIDRQA